MAIEVALWLRELELEQYAPGFADNHIDGHVLLELTAEANQRLRCGSGLFLIVDGLSVLSSIEDRYFRLHTNERLVL